jgi:hypothetical protein
MLVGKVQTINFVRLSNTQRSFFHRRLDRRKVVVGQHHVGCLYGHFRSGAPHRNADVRLLEGRRVVDAVARHRDDMAACLKRFDQPQFLFRRGPCEHGSAVGSLYELLPADGLQLLAGYGDQIAVLAVLESIQSNLRREGSPP